MPLMYKQNIKPEPIMKRFFKTAGLVLLFVAMMTPNVDGRGRNNSSGERRTSQTTHSQSSRPGNMGRSTHGTNRPGNFGNSQSRPGNGSSYRPGNSGNNRPDHGTRPGNGSSYRPGNSGNNRPDHGTRPGNGNSYRPGNSGNNRPDHSGNNRPDHGTRPGNGNSYRSDHSSHNRPQPGHNNWNDHGHQHNHPSYYGHRPHHIPHYHGWNRPMPPRHWHPAPGWRPFRSILGISLGTGFGISVNALINSGYNVNYYGDNTIYVSDAMMLNLLWPDAVLYYEGGGLCGSRFVYSTGYYDMNRYNMAYASLTNVYGLPVSVQNTAAGIEATWWGTGNQFIRLAFQSDYAQNGNLRYFTTLSFGN